MILLPMVGAIFLGSVLAEGVGGLDKLVAQVRVALAAQAPFVSLETAGVPVRPSETSQLGHCRLAVSVAARTVALALAVVLIACSW